MEIEKERGRETERERERKTNKRTPLAALKLECIKRGISTTGLKIDDLAAALHAEWKAPFVVDPDPECDISTTAAQQRQNSAHWH